MGMSISTRSYNRNSVLNILNHAEDNFIPKDTGTKRIKYSFSNQTTKASEIFKNKVDFYEKTSIQNKQFFNDTDSSQKTLPSNTHNKLRPGTVDVRFNYNSDGTMRKIASARSNNHNKYPELDSSKKRAFLTDRMKVTWSAIEKKTHENKILTENTEKSNFIKHIESIENYTDDAES